MIQRQGILILRKLGAKKKKKKKLPFFEGQNYLFKKFSNPPLRPADMQLIRNEDSSRNLETRAQFHKN